MSPYRYFLVETSLGWHKVLPDVQVVLLCPTTLAAQTLWAAWHFVFSLRMGPWDHQPAEEHRRFAWRFIQERGVSLWPAGPKPDPCRS